MVGGIHKTLQLLLQSNHSLGLPGWVLEVFVLEQGEEGKP